MWSGYLHLQSYKHIQSRFRLTLNINQMNMNESANRNEVYPHFHQHHSPEFSMFPSSFLMMVLCHSELHCSEKELFTVTIYCHPLSFTTHTAGFLYIQVCIQFILFYFFDSPSVWDNKVGVYKMILFHNPRGLITSKTCLPRENVWMK